MIYVLLIDPGDWAGLYDCGKLVYEGHISDVKDHLIERLGIHPKEVPCAEGYEAFLSTALQVGRAINNAK